MSVIGRVRRKQETDDAFVKGDKWDYWRVRTSCPPDTRIHMNGGWYIACPSAGDGYTYWQEELSINLSDRRNAYFEYEWTNPFWYVPAIAVFAWTGSYDIRLYGSDVVDWWGGGFEEFETFREAEIALDSFVTSVIDEIGSPLCRIMLRNDGRIGQVLENGRQISAIQPIDIINRGRSYLWGRFRRTYTI